jgi:phosphatidylglycerol:prolipoprotein diacylglycerol transferase
MDVHPRSPGPLRLHSLPVFLAESIVHTVDPFAIDFGGGFGIRWYGLSYAAGFLVAWLILRWLARTDRTPLSAAQASDLLTYLVVGVIVGGRLGDVLFYHQSLLWKFSAAFPFWGVLEIHKGGMSSHGGIVGVIVACIVFARRFRIPWLHVTDLACFVAPPGLAFGRLANWVNGELPGKALPASMQGNPPWWSVKYPDEILSEGFARSAELAQLPLVKAMAPVAASRGEPLPDAVFRACYAGQAELVGQVAPLLTARYPNNFIQAATDGLGLGLVMLAVWLVPRKPGVVSGAFLAAYGALRVASESFREPDDGVFSIGLLTLPMLLSLGMIIAGAVIIRQGSRAPGPAFGGLLRRDASP